jgi:hypothetical protein
VVTLGPIFPYIRHVCALLLKTMFFFFIILLAYVNCTRDFHCDISIIVYNALWSNSPPFYS